MSYRAAKISYDGSHYIATPQENFPQMHKRRSSHLPTLQEAERKERFETAYNECQQLPRKERKAYMRKAMEETIEGRLIDKIFECCISKGFVRYEEIMNRSIA